LHREPLVAQDRVRRSGSMFVRSGSHVALLEAGGVGGETVAARAVERLRAGGAAVMSLAEGVCRRIEAPLLPRRRTGSAAQDCCCGANSSSGAPAMDPPPHTCADDSRVCTYGRSVSLLERCTVSMEPPTSRSRTSPVSAPQIVSERGDTVAV
jgi:hypothetical protein